MRKPDPRIYAIACRSSVSRRSVASTSATAAATSSRAPSGLGMTALRIHVPYETPPDHANPWPGPEVSTLAQVLDWVA